MIITSKSFNEYKFPEHRNLLSNLARIYGGKDINIGDVMAYFFMRYMPSSFPRFIDYNKQIFSREFGITPRRIRIISGNFLPSLSKMCDIIKSHSNNERLENFSYLSLYFPKNKILQIRTEDVDDIIYDIHIPAWLIKKLNIFKETRYGYKYLFHDIHFNEDKMKSSFSTLNYILKQKSGLYASEYRSLRMRFLGTNGAVFLKDNMQSKNKLTKSPIVKKLAKNKKR